jgi:hypothetical protein
MRLSIGLLLASLAGVLGGAALISVPALGTAVIFDSLCVGVWALARDDGTGATPTAHGVPTVDDVLDRFRRAS